MANNQSVVTNEDASVAITLTGSDVENDVLTYTVLNQPANGTLSGTGADLTYTPNGDYAGLDSFTFQANDGTVDSNIATISITVDPVNDAPVANNQVVVTNEDASVAITLTGSDVENSSLAYVVVAQPTNGTLSGTGANLTYTPNSNYAGADSFTFQANDGDLTSAPATVAITVARIGVVGSNLVFEGKKVHIDLTNTGDTAIAMERLQLDWPDVNRKLTKIRVNDLVVYSTRIASPVLINEWKSGSLAGRTIAGGQTATLTLEFEKTVGANEGDYDLSIDFGDGLKVFIPMAQTNPPIAADDGYSVDEDSSVSIDSANGVLANDSDPDGDPFTAQLVADVSNGSLLLNSDGSFNYTPDPDFFGSDSFTYKANDGIADSGAATVTITVDPVNDPPVANDDSSITSENTAVLIDVLDNDASVDGDPLSITGTTNPTNGSIIDHGDGTVTYTPDPGFIGNDSFTYTIKDGNGDSDNAIVTISVTGNSAPIALADSYDVSEDIRRLRPLPTNPS